MTVRADMEIAIRQLLRSAPEKWFTAQEMLDSMPPYNNFAHGPLCRTALRHLFDHRLIQRRGLGGPKAKGRGGLYEYAAFGKGDVG